MIYGTQHNMETLYANLIYTKLFPDILRTKYGLLEQNNILVKQQKKILTEFIEPSRIIYFEFCRFRINYHTMITKRLLTVYPDYGSVLKIYNDTRNIKKSQSSGQYKYNSF